MLRDNPTMKALSRLGAIVALLLFLFSGLGPSIRYGSSIGHFMNEALIDTPFGGDVGSALLVGFGSFMGGLAGLMIFMLLGALLGTAIGAVAIRYIMEPQRERRLAERNAQRPAPASTEGPS